MVGCLLSDSVTARNLRAMASVKPRLSRSCAHGRTSSCNLCSWRVEWRRGGRDGDRESCTFLDRHMAHGASALAEARGHRITAEEVYAAVLGLDRNADAPPTLGEFAGEWIADRRGTGEVQSDTVDGQHRIIIRHVLPTLGHLPLAPSAITPETIKAWVKWMKGRTTHRGTALDADTIRRAHATLHSLLAAAVPTWLPANPAGRQPGQGRRSAVGLPKATPHDAMFLTAQEVALILAHCDRHVHGLAFVAVRTGLRLGELLALRVEDLTLTGSRKVIRVRQALKRDGRFGAPKSRRSRRDVSIGAEVAEELRGLVKGKRRSDLAFTSPRGKQWHPGNLASRHWLPALAAAQRCPGHPPPLPPKPKAGPRRKWRNDEISTCDCPGRLHRRPRFHDLRHTHVSLCAEAGWDMVRVSRRVGHEKIATTIDIYGHLWDVESEDRLDAVERLLTIAEDEAA